MRSLEREDVQRHRLVFPVLFFIKEKEKEMVSTRPRNPSQKTRVYAYARASAAHRSAVQLSVSSRRDDEKNVFVRFLSIFREESSSESMRRRARRLHLKCRPKVERTTFRHSLKSSQSPRPFVAHRSKKRGTRWKRYYLRVDRNRVLGSFEFFRRRHDDFF